MKSFNKLAILSVLSLSLSFGISCKGKTDNTSTTTVVDSSTLKTTAPVTISADDDLKKGVTDAVKDYPGVTAEVTDGVINLTGSINRSDWQKLNPTLNTLHPKRINSTNLTIK